MRILLITVLLSSLFVACNNSDSNQTNEAEHHPMDTARSVIEKAIARHGGSRYENMRLAFDFRDRHYTVEQEAGRYRYVREWTTDSTGTIRDLLTNEGFVRYQDGDPVNLSAEDSAKYANSVNSVAYFVLLPYGLIGDAVYTSYVGEVQIKGEPYHKVRVSFREEGGGTDFDDVFYYWFHQEKQTMNYLAYYYHTNGGGSRFRKAINPREINGLRVQDYINYTYTGDSVAVADYDIAFEEGRVKELSRIEKENVTIEPLK